MPGAYKLLWDFLYHDCDHAGIWIVDMDIAQVYLGKDMPINRVDAINYFNEGEVRIVEFDGGKKWFIPSFIEFQYGRLSEKNKAHSNVIIFLKKYNLINDDLTLLSGNEAPLKEHISPLQGDKEKALEKETDKEGEKEKGGAGEIKYLVPEMLSVWKKQKPNYPCDKNKDSTALQSIAIFISDHAGLNYQARDGDVNNQILNLWGVIAEFVSPHDFFKNYSLHQVEKHIQTITQEIQNGSSKGSKSGSSKVNGQQLNKAFADFYSQQKPA